mmetsp:Transcript_21435/g.61444  ORF Transcript_21435/g.61444 Transcript_21435/m.61444 type:complete len:87 (+) Transcript_21435:61-321(+)
MRETTTKHTIFAIGVPSSQCRSTANYLPGMSVTGCIFNIRYQIVSIFFAAAQAAAAAVVEQRVAARHERRQGPVVVSMLRSKFSTR